MIQSARRVLLAIAAAGAMGAAAPKPADAQAYPIDCAILLCLSGGWPASVPCARARAEFIRRITPWPVEPPLQIWRCPVGARFEEQGSASPAARLWDAVDRTGPDTSGLRLVDQFTNEEGRADVDIGGPEFDFVRSIRVFMVSGSQRESGPQGQEDCNRSSQARVGRYGTQGDYAWHRSSLAGLPPAYALPSGWGRHCPTARFRSVFVDWRDYQGNYGWERVDY
jgi:hypothetical protein